MNRIATSTSYSALIANLNDAQLRQIKAGAEVSSQRKASDLKGYARNAETLTAMQSLQTRLKGYIDQSTMLSERLTSQDAAMNKLADAAQGVRQSITDALASGRADTLMQEIRGFFSDAAAALNTRSQGRYLFAGGQLNTQPFTAAAMSDLTSAPALTNLFQNDQFKAVSHLDESATVQASFLADQLGLPLMQIFKDIQAFDQSASGPLNGQLTAAQTTFLQNQLDPIETVHDGLVNQAAVNGSYQRRVEDNLDDLQSRDTTITSMLEDVTGVNMPEAIARLQQAQDAVAAAAKVFTGLQGSSLLNFLQY